VSEFLDPELPEIEDVMERLTELPVKPEILAFQKEPHKFVLYPQHKFGETVKFFMFNDDHKALNVNLGTLQVLLT